MSDAEPGTTPAPKADGAELRVFAHAISDDLDVFADLHDREPSRAVIEALQANRIEDQLGLVLKSDAGQAALTAFRLAISSLPQTCSDDVLDELAAGYADVYLRHTYRASPSESVWLTEDGLERQLPMFEVRDFYKRFGLTVTDWANRPDDHIVLQHRFLARLFAVADSAEALVEPTQFLDAHLMRWIKRFAGRLVHGGAPDYFAALALLNASYLSELRDHLTELTGIPRPTEATSEPAPPPVDEPVGGPYVPGVAPSW